MSDSNPLYPGLVHHHKPAEHWANILCFPAHSGTLSVNLIGNISWNNEMEMRNCFKRIDLVIPSRWIIHERKHQKRYTAEIKKFSEMSPEAADNCFTEFANMIIQRRNQVMPVAHQLISRIRRDCNKISRQCNYLQSGCLEQGIMKSHQNRKKCQIKQHFCAAYSCGIPCKALTRPHTSFSKVMNSEDRRCHVAITFVLTCDVEQQ